MTRYHDVCLASRGSPASAGVRSEATRCHRTSVRRGSKKRFYKTYRQVIKHVTVPHHILCVCVRVCVSERKEGVCLHVFLFSVSECVCDKV